MNISNPAAHSTLGHVLLRKPSTLGQVLPKKLPAACSSMQIGMCHPLAEHSMLVQHSMSSKVLMTACWFCCRRSAAARHPSSLSSPTSV